MIIMNMTLAASSYLVFLISSRIQFLCQVAVFSHFCCSLSLICTFYHAECQGGTAVSFNLIYLVSNDSNPFNDLMILLWYDVTRPIFMDDLQQVTCWDIRLVGPRRCSDPWCWKSSKSKGGILHSRLSTGLGDKQKQHMIAKQLSIHWTSSQFFFMFLPFFALLPLFSLFWLF